MAKQLALTDGQDRQSRSHGRRRRRTQRTVGSTRKRSRGRLHLTRLVPMQTSPAAARGLLVRRQTGCLRVPAWATSSGEAHPAAGPVALLQTSGDLDAFDRDEHAAADPVGSVAASPYERFGVRRGLTGWPRRADAALAIPRRRGKESPGVGVLAD